MLMSIKISKGSDFLGSGGPGVLVFAHKCLNANHCWHFKIYEREKFYARLSWAWKGFYNLGARALIWSEL